MNLTKYFLSSLFLLSIIYPSISYSESTIPKSCENYSFSREPFISPKIVTDLQSWISDEGEQIVSINLPESMGTNRYFGDFTHANGENNGDYPTVTQEYKDSCGSSGCNQAIPYDSYRLIGTTNDNIYVVETISNGGGSGTFYGILLLKLETGKGFSYDPKKDLYSNNRQRCLLTRLEEIPLGDRSVKGIKMAGNIIYVNRMDGKTSSVMIE